MGRLINIGYGNLVNSDRIISVIRPDASPVKRMVQAAKDSGTCVDATCGRKCKAVLLTDIGHVVLSALLPDTIANRFNQKDIHEEGDL